MNTNQKIKQIAEIIKETDQIIKLDFSGLQSWKSLYDWPLHERRDLNGTLNVKCIHTDYHLRFLTMIPPGVSMLTQWHNCKEDCKVLAGILGDALNPSKKWTQDQVAVFKSMEQHKPINLSLRDFLYLQVDFYL